jgi:hypothetical protein
MNINDVSIWAMINPVTKCFQGNFKKRKIMMKDTNSKTKTGTKKKCEICGRDNHPTYKCHFKGKPKCGKCGKFGHTTEKCWENNPPEKKPEKEKEKEKERTNMAQGNENDSDTCYVT